MFFRTRTNIIIDNIVVKIQNSVNIFLNKREKIYNKIQIASRSTWFEIYLAAKFKTHPNSSLLQCHSKHSITLTVYIRVPCAVRAHLVLVYAGRRVLETCQSRVRRCHSRAISCKRVTSAQESLSPIRAYQPIA